MTRRNDRQFRAVLTAGHKGCAVEVPFDPSVAWGAAKVPLRPGRRGVPVAGTVNGVAFTSAIVGRMRRFFVVIDQAVRRKAGIVDGEIVHVVLRPIASAKAPSARLSAR